MSTGAGLATDDVVRLKTLREARLSPDGRRVAYTVCHTDTEQMRDLASIYLLDLDSGESRRLDDGDGFDVLPAWTPDGKAIVFRSLRDASVKARLLELDTGAETVIATHPEGLGTVGPLLSPDGSQVAYTASLAPPRDPTAPYRVTGLLWRIDGLGVVEDALGEVFVVPVGGGEPRRLSSQAELVVGLSWSFDGARLASLSIADQDAPRFVLRVIELASGQATEIWSGDFWLFPPAFAWLPDGRIVRSTVNATLGLGEPTRLEVASEENGWKGAPLDKLPAWPFGVVQGDFPWEALESPRVVVRPDGREVYLAAQSHGRIELWAVPLTHGAPRPLSQGDDVTIPFDASSTHVLAARTTMHQPPDLWLVAVDGSEERRLTDLNGALFPDTGYFDVHALPVTAEDGEPIDAWLLSPKGAEAPTRTVLANHGGPHASWGHAFSFEHCLLASAGYAVLLVNQRGSTGSSQEFAQAIHGRWGTDDCADLLSAVDAAIAAGFTDPDGLAVCGVSAGAYLAGRLITTTDRFKAAVVESPCLDMATMLGGDLGWLMPIWFGAGPGQGTEGVARLAAQSATTDAARCRTPTLIVQHERDVRTPPANADLFYVALRLGGCAAEMLRLPVTPHSGSIELGDPRARIAQNEALLEWLDRHLVPDRAAGH